MGFCYRALIGACVFGLSVSSGVTIAQESSGEHGAKNASAGSSKYIPPQPTKADPGFAPTPVKGQPAIARIKLDPESNDAINEAISEDANVIIEEVRNVAPHVDSELRTTTYSMRGIVEPTDMPPRGADAGMNRRALSLMRRSYSMRSISFPQAPRPSPKANISSTNRPAATGKVLANNFVIGTSASASELAPPHMLAAVESTDLESATNSDNSMNSSGGQVNAQSVESTTSPTVTDVHAKAEKPVAAASLHAARDSGRPADMVVLAPAPSLDRWDAYFLSVSKYYQFTEQQHAAGRRILDSLHARASQYRLGREKQFDNAAGLADKSQREARLSELNGPIDSMFHEFKVRLENLATLNQRHQATGPAPKG